jgi:hypothetical protein
MLGVLGVLLVMSVTLYMSGIVFPLSAVWLIHPHRRGRGLKVANVWVGICCAHVLLFFLLGAVFSLFNDMPFIAGATATAHPTAAGPAAAGHAGPLAELMFLAFAAIALFTAVFSPLVLLRFAPVGPSAAPAAAGPTGAPGGPGRLPGARRGGGSGRGYTTGGGAGGGGSTGSSGGGSSGGGSGAGPVGGGLAPSYAAYRREASAGVGSGAAARAGAGSGAGAAGRAGGAGPGGVVGGLAAAAGPVGAAAAVAAKGARKARAAGEAAAAHMGHADSGHGAGEGLAPRHHR